LKIKLPVLVGLYAMRFAVQAQTIQGLTNGVISGAITGEDGSTIAGAAVALQNVAPFSGGKPQQGEWLVTSGPGGSFQFDHLTAGNYLLCAQVPGSLWMNP